MTRWEKTYPPTPFEGALVLPWPGGSAPPDLPEGKAGISVWIRTRRTDNKHYVEPKAVGVDGLPVWHGVGRMVAVTEPGEHLVEVWGWGSAETVRGIRAVKQRADRRYRVRMSDEAGADPRAAGTGMFLADGRCPAGIAEGDMGALLITATAERKYSWNGLGFGRQPVTDPNAWLPWPTLAIDGARRPFAWRSWCYRLPPGAHEVTVEPAGDRPGSEPATVKVEIAPGRVTRLDLRVKAKIEVRAPDRDVPTEPAGFEATAVLKLSGPS